MQPTVMRVNCLAEPGRASEWRNGREDTAWGRLRLPIIESRNMTPHKPQATPDFPVLDTLAILGSGLIGTSVLRASKARGLFRRSVVWDIRAENRDFCVSSGWADAATDDLAEAVRDADLVVIATPAD